MLGGQLRAISLKDFRERMRVLAEELTRGGDPRIVLDRGLPVAILISFKEADTYARAEQGLAMLRGAGIYVEAAEGLDQLPEIVRGSQRVSESAKRTLNRRTRPIIGYLATIVSITALRSDMETYMAKVSRLGYVVTIAGRDTYAATLIGTTEFERLRALRPILGWFRSQGLDLSSAETENVDAFVKSFRDEAQPGAGTHVASA
jgi:PHD/YefM family antitoxin component YafN of YafNO toxin-antitoxin module